MNDSALQPRYKTITGCLNLQQLKAHLWNCAEILRGRAVDRTDWKAYILPLLLFKRICDVYDEKTAEAAELFGDVGPVGFPEMHRFLIPEGCHWRDVREGTGRWPPSIPPSPPKEGYLQVLFALRAGERKNRISAG